MRVKKIDDPGVGRPAVELLDDDGATVPEVADFLRLLTVRDYSPNTVRAYAHDLQKLYQFLQTEEELIADATERGWTREVERHRCTAERIRTLLTELSDRSENGQ